MEYQMDFLKELLSIREQSSDVEQVRASDLTVDNQVHNQLEKAAKEDDVDAQCFGLEMEDGKVVKVYVRQEDAEKFEEAMAKRLGEDDDIEAALEELGKEFEILEIVWPGDESEETEGEGEEVEADTEDEEDGDESLNDKVHNDKTDDKSAKAESLTIGQRFALKLQELKWSDDAADTTAQDKDPDEDNSEKNIEPADAKPQTNQGEDTEWRVEKDRNGMIIANDRFQIELSDDETLDLMNAIADKKIIRFKDENNKVAYVFSPRGNEYILKTPQYQSGFRIPKDVVWKILD